MALSTSPFVQMRRLGPEKLSDLPILTVTGRQKQNYKPKLPIPDLAHFQFCALPSGAESLCVCCTQPFTKTLTFKGLHI